MTGHFPLFLLKRSTALLLLLFLASCSASKKAFTGIDKELNTSPIFKKGFTGLAVYDPEKGKMLYEYNSNKYFTPASGIKLLTFYASLKVLGDSVPALKYTLSGDSLFFSGTGDPSLLHPDLPESSVIDFLKNTSRELVYLPPLKSEEPLGPGWAWDDYPYYFSAERSDLPVFGNSVVFRFSEGSSEPEIIPEIFKDSISSEHSEERIKRDRRRNIFRLAATPAKKDLDQKVPFITSEETLIKILEDTLGRKIALARKHPEKNLTKKTFFSIHTDSLYRPMLQDSDNFMAEQLLRIVTLEISDTLSVKEGIAHIKENFLYDLPDDPVWVDGSGLSRYNLITPGSMVKLLEKIKVERNYENLFVLLPAGGNSGTLKNQFLHNEPFIFAKTGSMSNNYSLNGYLKTEKGKILIFSFMNSNYTVASPLLKQEMEKILRTIRTTH